MSDGYTTHPTKVRITHDDYDTDYPWVVDGHNPHTGEYTEAVCTYRTWEEAISQIPVFVEASAREGVIWPWSRTFTIGRALDAARALMPEAEADNPEYVRALVELLTDITGLPHDTGRDLVRLALRLPMETP